MKKELIKEINNFRKNIGFESLNEGKSKLLKNFTTDVEMGPKYHAARPLGNWQSDNAWDLMAPANTQWNSITKGIVSKVYNTGKSTGKVYGTQVTVKGKDGYPDIFYTHLKNVTVSPGDEVEIGTPIGKISEWGNSPSTHVHVGLPYGEHIKDLLTPDFSSTSEEGIQSDSSNVEDGNYDKGKLEKILDFFGLGKLATMDLDKDGKNFAREVSDLFGGGDEKSENPDEIKVAGYGLKDLISAAKNALSEDIQKKKKIIK
jgi:hypothetical protein